MIARMKKVLLVGKKSLLPQALEFLQNEGYFHIQKIREGDHLPYADPTVREKSLQSIQDRLQRVESLLALLGRGIPDISDSPALPPERIEAKTLQLNAYTLASKEELDFLRSYEKILNYLLPFLKALENSQHFQVLGFLLHSRDKKTFSKLREALTASTDGRVEVHHRMMEENLITCAVAFLISDEEKVRSLLNQFGVKELQLPSLARGLSVLEASQKMKERLISLPAEICSLDEQFKNIKIQQGPHLLHLRCQLKDELEKEGARALASSSRFTFLLEGWIPQKMMKRLGLKLRENFGGQLLLEELLITEEERKEVPVLLENSRIFRPFELILGIFRLPRYGRIDPTPIMGIFFPLFFGLIIGDIGYGLLLLIPFLLIYVRGRKRVFRSIALIGILCAGWTIVFGLAFGELFGTLGESIGLHPLILDRMHALTTFLIIALALGLIQIFLGFFIQVYLSLREREYKEAIEALGLVFWIIGALLLVFTLVGLIPDKAKSLTTYLSLAMLFGGWGSVIFVKGPIMGLIEPLSVTGNILSYARLFGIGISSVYLAFAANTMGGLFSNVFVAVLITIIAHLLFFTLGVISPIIQSARLHFVEFFSKFKYHDFSGSAFKPLAKTKMKGAR